MGGQLADHGDLAGGVSLSSRRAGSYSWLAFTAACPHRGWNHGGQEGLRRIDGPSSASPSRAHTATHMVARGTAGYRVGGRGQAGSENSPSRLGFDFRRGSALGLAAPATSRLLVNEKLAEGLAVTTES